MKKEKAIPPETALRFLRWFCREDYLEEIEGDLTELFEKQAEQTPKKAKWTFFWQVLRYFRPDFIKAFQTQNTLLHTAMMKHNFLITYRGFLRNKTSFLINLLGLSTGLACVLLIYLWVSDELNVDNFHQKDGQLYQVMHNLQFPDDIMTLGGTPIPLAEALAQEVPEVESALAISRGDQRPEGVLSIGEHMLTARGIHAGENFFNVLSYRLLHGNSKEVLANKNSIVLSESLAQKIFPSATEAIGQTLEWKDQRSEGSFLVTGVFSNPPANSTIQFDFIFPLQILLDANPESKEWYSSHAQTLLVLQEGTNIEQLNRKIAKFIKGRHSLSSEISSLFVQQFSSKYLYGHYENGVQAGGRILYVKLFSLIALFILVIACINFMNLSTAQASKKMTEIGIKKAIGANRRDLIVQFLGESLLIAFLALFIAIVWIVMLLPQFNIITGKSLHLNMAVTDLLWVLGVVIFTGIAAGSYPALYLSRFESVVVLKGKLQLGSGGQSIRRALVIFQFALSVIFIVGVLIINQQVEFTMTKNLGYQRDHIISFERKGRLSTRDFNVFMTELKQVPGVERVSNVAGDFIEARFGNASFSWEGKTEEQQFPFPSPEIGFGFIETLGMEMVAGRSFSKKFNDDRTKIIINEAAANMMQLADPVGKVIQFGKNDRQIIGVVKNFNLKSLHQTVEPLFFRLEPYGPNIVVKVHAETERKTIEQLTETYEIFHSGYPFAFTFLDEDYQRLYESETKVAVLSTYFAGLAILISCLGLFGLAAFTAERRTKEIGIRKILGSSVWGIVSLLSADFTKMVLVAIAIAIPISYLFAQRWLENFAYTIELKWWMFGIAALITLLIAWLTVGFQTLKAATINPVDCLRDE